MSARASGCGRPGASASLVRVGLGLRYGTDKGRAVTSISTGNADDVAANVKAGDVLMAVDGKNVCDGLHHTAATTLAGHDGQRKKLQLRRAGKPLEVTVTVRDDLLAPPSGAAAKR
jgi:C-terminal processing protease CtpA/Prc